MVIRLCQSENCWKIIFGFLLIVQLAACSTGGSSPNPGTDDVQQAAELPATELPRSTKTIEPPTDTPVPPPTDTPIPPTDTPVPPTNTPAPTNTPEVTVDRFPLEGLFTAYGDEPVIRSEMIIDLPGAVVYHQGLFHMFVNSKKNTYETMVFHYFTSPDGYNWTQMSAEPLFLGPDLRGTQMDFITLFLDSVIVEDDGTWVLYYSTIESEFTWPPGFEGGIGRATAPDPMGPWTPDTTLVLQAGNSEEWDSLGVQDASVLRTDEGYVMYYTGYSAAGSRHSNSGLITQANAAIGMATSPDGVEWTKITEPVLTASGEEDAWDQSQILAPHVLQTPDGWVMLYRGERGNVICCNQQVRTRKYGLAISEDGLQWIRSDVAFSISSMFGVRQSQEANLVYRDGTYFLYIDGNAPGSTNFDIHTYLATYENLLIP